MSPELQATQLAHLKAVTQALGGTVNKQCSENDWGAWVNATVAIAPRDHTTVSVSLFYHTDRKGDYIAVSGDWPRDAKGNVVTGRDAEYKASNPSINVSAAKRPEVAAADIRRRFMPEYVPLYAKASSVIASRNNFEADVAGNWRALAAACGGKLWTETNRAGITGLPESVTIKYVSDSRVDLVLDCTIEQACAILKARAAA